MRIERLAITLTLLAAVLSALVPAHAAEGYDNCTGFIDAVPATISTQGTWCLRHDVGTAIVDGSAIQVATNNVTIDCNDFKLGGLAAGAGTQASGVSSQDRLNISIRNCNVRGFLHGINLGGAASGGHVVEDNRLEANTLIGIAVDGSGSVVRRNRIVDTGGSTWSPGAAYGIEVVGAVDVIDNSVSGVVPVPGVGGNGTAMGIVMISAPWGSIRDNRVQGLVPLLNGDSVGILVNDAFSHVAVRRNEIAAAIGVLCQDTYARAMDNIIRAGSADILLCRDDGNTP